MPPASLPALAAINPGPNTARSRNKAVERPKRKRDRACFFCSARPLTTSFCASWGGVSIGNALRKEEMRDYSNLFFLSSNLVADNNISTSGLQEKKSNLAQSSLIFPFFHAFKMKA